MRITADLVEQGVPKKNPNPVDPMFHAEYPNEKKWQQTVSNWFKQMGGWYAYHTYRSTNSPAGFPDIVALYPFIGRLVWAELKTEKGEVSDDQMRWLASLALQGQEVYIWRPSDTDEIQAVLKGAHDDAFSLRERGFIPKKRA